MDSGATWTLTLDAFTESVAPDPGHPGTVFATAYFAYRSQDYGATWLRMSSHSDRELTELACDADGIVYAASTSVNPYFGALGTPLRSDDGGSTFGPIGGWDQFAAGFPFRTNTVAVDRGEASSTPAPIAASGQRPHAGLERSRDPSRRLR